MFINNLFLKVQSWFIEIYRVIIFTGYIALIAVITGTNAQGSTYEIPLFNDIFRFQNNTSAPLIINYCENNVWPEKGLLLSHKEDNFCTNKEGNNEYSKRFTYIQR